ncbi:MAG: ROK family protein [Herpetosiphonaceae bacterium]|nr:ROK family protein [Herpetosiphonaceae bacterium]
MADVIGIDLGGTQLRAVRCDADGVIKAHLAMPTPTSGPSDVVAAMTHLIEALRADAAANEISGIGVGTPGPVDGPRGIVFEAPNLPGWNNVPLKDMLRARLQLPVEVGNDANVAGLGEWIFGSGRGTRDFVYVTISTGIGGGVIMDGRLLLGRKGMAAEVGHMIIEANGPICGCGNRGCWEVLASGTALARRAAEEMQHTPTTKLHSMATPATVTAVDVWEAAQQHDALSRTLLHEEGTLIGVGVVNLLHLFSPARIALGGGVMHSFELLRDPLLATITARAMESYRDVPVTIAKLGQNVGVLGAAALLLLAQPQAHPEHQLLP